MKNVKPTVVTLAVLNNIAIGQDSVPDRDDKLNAIVDVELLPQISEARGRHSKMLFYEHLLIGILTN
ncbi:unnamed protein product [Parnassius mnemosyne]|uniref:Uncharacterized protein n=1 Tax=Parnassius mnemosyne TaxID=213953 RepID=A0AAV1KHD7_9NEOP